MLALQDGGRADISANYAAIRHKGEVSVQRASPASADYEYALAVPGAVAVPECGLRLETEVVGRRTKGKETVPGHLLDPRFAGTPLVLRNWRAGDRFWPAHSKQPRKIKELLQDRHITGDEKKGWPVVAGGDKVIWLRGFGVRRDYQSRDRKGIVIREVSGK
jgi:tRNA(Ile)-lysidine synthase